MTETGEFSLTGVEKRFGGHVVLRSVNLRFPSGRITVVLGPSGCGKTTMLRILAGLEAPDAGRVTLDGRLASDPGIRIPVEARGVGMVFQDALLWPHLTVRGNVAFPLGVGHRNDPRVLESAREARVSDFLDRYPAELSGGERRRVSIARAITGDPRLFLLDEPLSGLDANLRVRLLSTIRSIQRKRGLTTVYVTHDQEEALGLADQIVVMRDGEVLQEGPPGLIYARPRTSFVARFVGLSTIIAGDLRDGMAETPLGTFPGNGESVGRQLFAVRPETVRIADGEGSAERATGGNGVAARVTDCLYRGDRWLVTLRLADLDLLAFSPESREQGEEVRIRVITSPVPVEDDEGGS